MIQYLMATVQSVDCFALDSVAIDLVVALPVDMMLVLMVEHDVVYLGLVMLRLQLV